MELLSIVSAVDLSQETCLSIAKWMCACVSFKGPCPEDCSKQKQQNQVLGNYIDKLVPTVTGIDFIDRLFVPNGPLTPPNLFYSIGPSGHYILDLSHKISIELKT